MSPTGRSISPREFVILIALMMSIVALTIDAILPALGLVRAEMPTGNDNHAQYIVSFIFFGMALGQLIYGPLSDALGRKRIFYIGISLYCFGSLVCYFAPSMSVLLAGRALEGLGVAAPYVTAISIVRDRFAGADMARIMSLALMVFMAVPALAPSVGQLVMYVSGWREIFLLYVGYSILLGLWIFLRMEETLPVERRIPFSMGRIALGFREAITHPVTMSYAACAGLIFGSFIGYLNSCQQIFQEQYGVGEWFVVYFGALAGVLAIASNLNSRIVMRWGMAAICRFGVLSLIAASALMLFLHLFMEPNLWVFMVYAVMLFFSFGLVIGNLNALAMEPMGHVAGTAAAVVGFSSSMMSVLIGTGVGQLYNNTLIPIAGGFTLFGTVAFGIMLFARGKAAQLEAAAQAHREIEAVAS